MENSVTSVRTNQVTVIKIGMIKKTTKKTPASETGDQLSLTLKTG